MMLRSRSRAKSCGRQLSFRKTRVEARQPMKSGEMTVVSAERARKKSEARRAASTTVEMAAQVGNGCGKKLDSSARSCSECFFPSSRFRAATSRKLHHYTLRRSCGVGPCGSELNLSSSRKHDVCASIPCLAWPTDLGFGSRRLHSSPHFPPLFNEALRVQTWQTAASTRHGWSWARLVGWVTSSSSSCWREETVLLPQSESLAWTRRHRCGRTKIGARSMIATCSMSRASMCFDVPSASFIAKLTFDGRHLLSSCSSLPLNV